MRKSRAVIVPVLIAAGCVSGSYVASPGGVASVPVPTTTVQQRSPFRVVLPAAANRDSSFWAQSIDSVRNALSTEIQRALLLQRRAWIDDEYKQHLPAIFGAQSEPESQRAGRVHCHRELFNGPTPWSPVVVRAMISSNVSKMSLCPEWIPRFEERGRDPSHEYVHGSPDVARLVPFSSEVIAALDSARRLHPTYRFFTGQLVRVLTENRSLRESREVLRQCRLADGWCDLLSGYVAHESGDYAAADSFFTAGLIGLPKEERCEWESIDRLLPARERSISRDCTTQSAFIERFWWLANPLLSKPGNFRRSEHYMRTVRNHLVSELPLDARYNLLPEKGLDAIVELRMRYGWPDHQVWGGEDVEREHNLYLLADAGPPYSSPEYVSTATSTVPRRQAVDSPFTVRDADFELTPNLRERWHWWPYEHVRLKNGSIVAFPEPQYVLLRRSQSARLLIAADIRGGQLTDATGTSVEAKLVASSQPREVRLLSRARTRVGERLVIETAIDKPAIVSLEAEIGTNNVAAARTRRGVSKVPTIEGIASGGCAVSMPILVNPSMPRTSTSASLREHMMGSLALESPSQVGLAWESYGFVPGDTTTVTISVSRHTEVGALRSFAMRVGLSGDPRRPISITWREPDASRDIRLINELKLPTTLRTMVLNVANLSESSYSVSVSMQSSRCSAVSEPREFSIWR